MLPQELKICLIIHLEEVSHILQRIHFQKNLIYLQVWLHQLSFVEKEILFYLSNKLHQQKQKIIPQQIWLRRNTQNQIISYNNKVTIAIVPDETNTFINNKHITSTPIPPKILSIKDINNKLPYNRKINNTVTKNPDDINFQNIVIYLLSISLLLIMNNCLLDITNKQKKTKYVISQKKPSVTPFYKTFLTQNYVKFFTNLKSIEVFILHDFISPYVQRRYCSDPVKRSLTVRLKNLADNENCIPKMNFC